MKVALICSECGNRNYRVEGSLSTRLEVKKYCKTCNRHTTHKSSI
ncbi:50S ribosomal protein L33 [Phocicoccus schoeneichii]|nr:50S ribosomal protein L33 [Jeotgalicoccus schoeneichii]